MNSRISLRMLAGAISAFGMTLLMLGCGEPATEEPTESSALPLDSGIFKNLYLESINCREVTLLFDRVSTYAGRPITRFRLLRDGRVVNTVTPNPSGSGQMSIRDGYLTPGTGATHAYKVRVENDQGRMQASSALRWVAAPCAPSKSYVIAKFQPSNLPAYSEYAADGKVLEYFMSDTDTRSAKNYFKEVSYNKTKLDVVEYPGWFTMNATHAQLCESSIRTSSAGKKYCVNAKPSKVAEARASFLPAVEAAYPGREVIVVLNGVEHADSDPQFGAHRFLDSVYDPYETIYHELGHNLLAFDEGWLLACPGVSAFPASFRNIRNVRDPDAASGCTWHTYGSPYDPMNGASAHFHALHKLQAGWLTPSDVIIRNIMTLGRQVTYSLRAVDAQSKSSAYKYAILMRYDRELDGYLTFEYRRRVGQNRNVPGFEKGIYVTAFPGVNPTKDTLEANDSSFNYGDILAPEPEVGKSIATAAAPFLDHHRGLRVSLESNTSTDATVKIARCHEAEPSAQCIVQQDAANYRSPGFCCFCGTDAGAWKQQTATTVKCSIGATPTH